MATIVQAGISFDTVAIIAGFILWVDQTIAAGCLLAGVAAVVVVKAVAIITVLALLDDAVTANGCRTTAVKARRGAGVLTGLITGLVLPATGETATENKNEYKTAHGHSLMGL